MRKIEIYEKHLLTDKNLLFISGFYNLESIQIGAILLSHEQLERLEKLRELRCIFCSNETELEEIKKKHKESYQKLIASNAFDVRLKNYLMMQRMFIENNYQDLLRRLYVLCIERVKWENKISTKEFAEIRDALIEISKMSRVERKNI